MCALVYMFFSFVIAFLIGPVLGGRGMGGFSVNGSRASRTHRVTVAHESVFDATATVAWVHALRPRLVYLGEVVLSVCILSRGF